MRMGLAGTSAVAAASVLVLTGVAQADSMVSFDSTSGSFQSFENTGASFTATWSYTNATQLLTLSLINTSPVGPEGGAITAIAFNDPNSPMAGPSNLIFNGVTGDNDGGWFVDGVTPPPASLGNFNSIYTVDGTDYTGAGTGSTGIEYGEVALFSWTVTGDDADLLSVFDFLDLDANSLGYGFAVRFKGIGDNGDSDSVVLVPLPRAVWFGAIGLLGIVVIRRQILA